MTPPTRIYFQTGDEPPTDYSECTWCADRINDSDVEYVRADRQWISVEERMPEKFCVVLTQHIDDLYPCAAYTFDGVWLRETEGPEDDMGEGKNMPLCRPPTHWQPLPAPPAREEKEHG